MALNTDKPKLSAYEDIIRQVRGVVSSRVVVDNAGEVAEIHVLADSDKSPKQVVRDIESLFMVTYGTSVDHRKISVAQLKDSEADCSGAGQNDGKFSNIRPQIASITLISGGRTAETRVNLEIAGQEFAGEATGPSTASNKLRLISQATLIALEKYMESVGSFLAEDVSVITVSGCRAVVVSVSVVTNDREERLIGAAFINNDEREASVKATLSAVNRRLDVLFYK